MRGPSHRLRALAALALAVPLALAACGGGSVDPAPPAPTGHGSAAAPSSGATPVAEDDHPIEATRPEPLRPGERRLRLTMPATYTPSAPYGTGTDDYRCFLLDPGLTEDAFVTSTRIEPQAAGLVHHVILFRVPPESIASAEKLDAAAPGEGWTCFGGSGVRTGSGKGLSFLDSAGWIAAWAPGTRADRQDEGTGVLLTKGSRIVMQVHYNLLNKIRADRSTASLTTVPATTGLEPVETMLLPAPVEVPCPKATTGPLCDRSAALFDQISKYGNEAGLIPTGLLALCAKDPAKPPTGAVSTCTRKVTVPTTIRAVGGHMHLLGTSIKIELNPGTSRSKLLLQIPRWDFHWQGAYFLAKPITAQPGDTLRVTCTFDAKRRAQAKPAQKPRYTLWGEGTTDEMCLGVLQVTRE